MSVMDDEVQVCACGHLRRSHASYIAGQWSGSVGGGTCGYCECPQMRPDE